MNESEENAPKNENENEKHSSPPSFEGVQKGDVIFRRARGYKTSVESQETIE